MPSPTEVLHDAFKWCTDMLLHLLLQDSMTGCVCVCVCVCPLTERTSLVRGFCFENRTSFFAYLYLDQEFYGGKEEHKTLTHTHTHTHLDR